MTTATFRPYDKSNSETELHTHDGERVEVLKQHELDHGEFTMFDVLTSDGLTLQAFADELTEWSLDA